MGVVLEPLFAIKNLGEILCVGETGLWFMLVSVTLLMARGAPHRIQGTFRLIGRECVVSLGNVFEKRREERESIEKVRTHPKL